MAKTDNRINKGSIAPTLQQVTTAGNETTDGIGIQSLIIKGGDAYRDLVDDEMSVSAFNGALDNNLVFNWLDNQISITKPIGLDNGLYNLMNTPTATPRTIAFTSITKSANFTAENEQDYTSTATLTVTDGTNNWANDGNTSFTAPVDWAKTTINNVGPIYYVRVGTVSGTFSTEPTLRFCLPQARTDIFSNGEMDSATGWTVTGDWAYSTNDHTFTFSSGSGTLSQASASFANPAKPNTWYRFRYVVSTAGPSTTQCWIGDEFATGKTYFRTDSTSEIDVFFFLQ